jgi:hypothetical protein
MTGSRILPLCRILLAAGVAGGIATGAAATTTPTHKLLATVLESGDTGQTLPAGYTTMEVATVKCPYYTCTIAMSIMSSVGKATCTNEWAIVGLVDGSVVDGAPLQGALPNSGKTQTRTWQGVSTTVGNGKHTAAFQIYVPCSANAYQWSVDYMVTTP